MKGKDLSILKNCRYVTKICLFGRFSLESFETATLTFSFYLTKVGKEVVIKLNRFSSQKRGYKTKCTSNIIDSTDFLNLWFKEIAKKEWRVDYVYRNNTKVRFSNLLAKIPEFKPYVAAYLL